MSAGRRAAAAFVALALAACGGDSGLGRGDTDFVLRAELVIESAPPGAEGSVVIDSVRWDPAVLLPTGDDSAPEVEGPFRIDFRNTGTQALALRYDLRFHDDSDLFVDRFIPFGQPLRLDPGQVRRQEGRFVIRSTPQVGRFRLRLMRIAVRVAAADSAGDGDP